ncbi:MAG: hypothetical protein Q9186_004663 [Xanthomendoza sp. 1 TL-2023]
MPSNEAIAKIIGDLHTYCTFPAANELDDDTCHVCHSSFNDGSEKPIKLGCGHVFGTTCITRWTLDKTEDGKAADCPICRQPCLPAQATSSRTATDTTRMERMLRMLESNTPGAPSSLSGEQEIWVYRAERLWEFFCNDIVSMLDFENVFSVQNYLSLRIGFAISILSFGSVYNFYQAYISPSFEPLDSYGHENFPDSYYPLIWHLDRARDVLNSGSDADGIRKWRVYQALQTPTMAGLEDLVERMAETQVEVTERIGQLRSDAGL